jgi:predicted transcriptional regulator
MARRSSSYPTELELEILKILWREGEGSVRQVREQLSGFRNLAHTSVMTMMSIMKEKGYLKRTKKGKEYIYEPRVSREQTTRRMLGDMVDRVFHGSTMAAMVNMLEMGDIDEKELAELRRLIDQKEKGE